MNKLICDTIVDRYSIEYSLENSLIKALIQTESSFRERAYRFEPCFYKKYIKNNTKYMNHKYYGLPRIISASYSLCQIMFLTAEELIHDNLEPETLYDPEFNIKLGCMLLKKKMDKYGIELGILAYNSGSPRGEEPTLEHNYEYLRKVAKNYKKFGGVNQIILKHL